MRRLTLMGIVLTMPLLSVAGEDLAPRVEASRSAVEDFMQQLKGALQQAMKEQGPVEAIAVCQQRAPQIAQELSASRGWQMGRTSLKLRNPANAPDDWERQVLERFEARKAQGEPASQLEHYEVVEQEGRPAFRYMKAIPTGELCLVCHGENVSAPIKKQLAELYPHDEATGFRQGDVRGAFTIFQPLED